MSAANLLTEARDLLSEHLRDYLPAGLEVPKKFTIVPRTSTLADTKLPAVQVSSAGLLGRPVKHDGEDWAEWSVGVSVWCRARDWDETQQLTLDYALAVQPCMASRPDLAGADGYRWVDTRLGLPDERSGRTLGGCTVVSGYWLPAPSADLTKPGVFTRLDSTVTPVPITEESP